MVTGPDSRFLIFFNVFFLPLEFLTLASPLHLPMFDCLSSILPIPALFWLFQNYSNHLPLLQNNQFEHHQPSQWCWTILYHCHLDLTLEVLNWWFWFCVCEQWYGTKSKCLHCFLPWKAFHSTTFFAFGSSYLGPIRFESHFLSYCHWPHIHSPDNTSGSIQGLTSRMGGTLCHHSSHAISPDPSFPSLSLFALTSTMSFTSPKWNSNFWITKVFMFDFWHYHDLSQQTNVLEDSVLVLPTNTTNCLNGWCANIFPSGVVVYFIHVHFNQMELAITFFMNLSSI